MSPCTLYWQWAFLVISICTDVGIDNVMDVDVFTIKVMVGGNAPRCKYCLFLKTTRANALRPLSLSIKAHCVTGQLLKSHDSGLWMS
jgi:hypothetical protein